MGLLLLADARGSKRRALSLFSFHRPPVLVGLSFCFSCLSRLFVLREGALFTPTHSFHRKYDYMTCPRTLFGGSREFCNFDISEYERHFQGSGQMSFPQIDLIILAYQISKASHVFDRSSVALATACKQDTLKAHRPQNKEVQDQHNRSKNRYFLNRQFSSPPH